MTIIELKSNQLLDSPYSKQVLSYVRKLRKLPKTIKLTMEDYLSDVKNGIYFLLVENNNLIGLARYSDLDSASILNMNLQPTTSLKAFKLVSSVYVDKKYRGKGYSKVILNYMLKKHSKLLLDTYADWIPAVTLYLSVGFKPIDSSKHGKNYLVLFSTHPNIKIRYKPH
jgi:GNAT superfamily N-acetyltransferase